MFCTCKASVQLLALGEKLTDGIYELKLSRSEDIKRHLVPFLLWVRVRVQETKPRALGLLDKRSTTELNPQYCGAGDVAQWLRASAAFSSGPGSTPLTHVVAHTHL